MQRRTKRKRDRPKVSRAYGKTLEPKRRSNGASQRHAQAAVKGKNYAARYQGDYRYTCAIAHAATGNRCSWCMARKSEEIHHVHYRDALGAIAGREVPGVDIFPACLSCHHGVCHSKLNWVEVRVNPALNNHNTAAFKAAIKKRFRLLEMMKG